MKRTTSLPTRLTKRSAFRARLILAFAVSALLLSWNFPGPVHAADGELDTGFADAGKIVADNGRGEQIKALALQPDGKLIGVGYMETKKRERDFVVGRLLSDGNEDVAFGPGGLVTLDFFKKDDEAHAVVIQADGKIVVGGEAANPAHTSSDFALARFNSDGSLDTSFGAEGLALTDFAGKADHVLALALQSDGKIVAAGFAQFPDQTEDFALARYNSDGSLDVTFGESGKVHTDFLNSADQAYAVVIQQDGKMVLAGNMGGSSPSGNFALARYNSDGSLDSSFGYSQNGKVNVDFAGQNDRAYALALQPDGKLVAAGYAYDQGGGDSDVALARFNANGTLDESFGNGGRITTDFVGRSDSACGAGLQPDGKIVAAGYAGSPAGKDFALLRYNPDGSLDPSFGAGGKTTTDFLGQDDWAWGMTITPLGRLVAAGYATGAANDDFAVACYRIFAAIPTITGAEVRGKKLFVYGKSFDNGAQLLMNGEPQVKTFNDETTPFTQLTARKSGKKIAPGETVMLQVRNPDGALSNEFSFTRPLE